MKDAYVKERDRAGIPDKYQWDLTDIYSNDAEWTDGKKKLVSRFPSLSAFQGTLAKSAANLLQCLELLDDLSKESTRLACYAGMKSDLDTRDAVYLAMDQEMNQIGSELASVSSFIEPEILTLGQEAIELYIKEEQRLGAYRHIFEDILRKKDHTKSEAEEKIIAEATLMADSPQSINSVFTNADFPYPEVTLENGTAVKLDPPAFSLQRRSEIREDRKKVFAAYMGKMNEFRRTFGAQLSAETRKNIFFTKARAYNSCLERALDNHNIPTAVYQSLISGVRNHFDTFHRYLGLRKRLLGIDELHYYDLYAPLIKQMDLNYSFDEGVELVLASLEPLGKDYLDVARTALFSRWIDVYHNEGKRSGAYSNGAVYDVHPYMLLNYNGKYDDVSTLTHELGHTMHSYLANKRQPYALSHYSIFVAEVASTFNEALLLEYMLKTESTDEVRLSLLGDYLDNARATVFRQTQFAEFELAIHEKTEQGTALTGDLLNSLYASIAKEYYGHEKGVCVVDDEIKSEWTYIPHFYYNFYVYQYATSFTASAALSEGVLAGEPGAAERYLDLLSSGGSDYPIELLKKAGVDMTSAQPLNAAIARMNRVMDEIEKIAERLGLFCGK